MRVLSRQRRPQEATFDCKIKHGLAAPVHTLQYRMSSETSTPPPPPKLRIVLLSHITARSAFTVCDYIVTHCFKRRAVHLSLFDPVHRVLAVLIGRTFEQARRPESMALPVTSLMIASSTVSDAVRYSDIGNNRYCNVASTFAESMQLSYYDMLVSLARVEIARLVAEQQASLVVISDVKLLDHVRVFRAAYGDTAEIVHAHLDISMVADDLKSPDLQASAFENEIPSHLRETGVAQFLLPSSEKKPAPHHARTDLRCLTLNVFAAVADAI